MLIFVSKIKSFIRDALTFYLTGGILFNYISGLLFNYIIQLNIDLAFPVIADAFSWLLQVNPFLSEN